MLHSSFGSPKASVAAFPLGRTDGTRLRLRIIDLKDQLPVGLAGRNQERYHCLRFRSRASSDKYVRQTLRRHLQEAEILLVREPD
jgi:hypothetical protein